MNPAELVELIAGYLVGGFGALAFLGLVVGFIERGRDA